MKVCDAHPTRIAVDTIHVVGDDSRIDVCDECKYAVMELLSRPPEFGESQIAPSSDGAQQKAPKRGLSISRKQ